MMDVYVRFRDPVDSFFIDAYSTNTKHGYLNSGADLRETTFTEVPGDKPQEIEYIPPAYSSTKDDNIYVDGFTPKVQNNLKVCEYC